MSLAHSRDVGPPRASSSSRAVAARARLADLAALRRPPDGAARAPRRGAAEHAARARAGRGGPLGLVRRDPGPAAAQHPADLRHRRTAPTVDAAGHQVRDFHRSHQGPAARTGRRTARSTRTTYYWAHATFVEHMVVATDTFIRRLSEAGEGPDRRGVGHLVRALRRLVAGHPATWARVRGVLAARARRAPGRAPHREVRRRLRHQGLAAAPEGARAAVVAGASPDRHVQRVPHHRRAPAAGPASCSACPGPTARSGATSGSPPAGGRSTPIYARLPARWRMHPIPLRAYRREGRRP